MRAFGTGILPGSTITLYNATDRAKQCFLYALCAGHYLCDSSYIVDRAFYNSILILYVRRGRMFYEQDGERRTVREHGFALIDCFRPHRYGSIGACEISWVHFDGSNAREIYHMIAQRGEMLPRQFDRCASSLSEISERPEANGQLPEPEMHRLLTDILMEFMIDRKQIRPAENEDVIESIRAYIAEHPQEDLTVPALAARANLSEYHFLRIFKQHVGMTPHSYILFTRLNVAEFYLVTSDYSVKEIAFHCGFTSESAFCTCFKRLRGTTPMEYRRVQTSS